MHRNPKLIRFGLHHRTYAVLSLACSAMLMLSGCLENLKPPKEPRPSPTPVQAGKCEPSESFELNVKALGFLQIPEGILKKPGNGKKNGKGSSIPLLNWYMKWIAATTSSPYGKNLVFPINDPRLGGAQFTSSVLKVESLVFDVEKIRWERVLLGINGIKGSQIDPSALKIEILETYDLDLPLPLSAKYLIDNDEEAEPAHKNKNFPLVLVRSVSKIRLTLDLKKFSFGAHTTSDDLIRKSAGKNLPVFVRLKHLNGWVRTLESNLALAGMTAGICPEPTPPIGDNTPPTIRIDSQSVTGLSSSTSQTISFSASEPVAFTCSFDQGPFSDCSLSSDSTLGHWSGENLADGNHQLSIRAQDAAGNSSEVISAQWSVDTVKPEVSFVNAVPPERVTASTSFEMSFSVSEAAQITCSIDRAAPEPCSSPLALTGLSDGDHSIEIRAKDLAGLDSDPLVYEWNVLSVPPSVQITHKNPSTSPVASDSIKFEFSGATGTRGYVCSLDKSTYASCSSPVTLSALADGAHLFEVRAVDAMNRRGEPASHSWTVDTLAPEVFIISSSIPSSPTSQDALEIVFGASETSNFSCAIDSTEMTACTSPMRFENLSEGQHRLLLIATDPAGNSSSPLEYAWVVDKTPPLARISSTDPSGALINKNSLRVSLEANEPARFECRLDGGAFSGCANETLFADLSDGSHKVEARAIDNALNVGPIVSHEFTVDTHAPGVSITSVTPSAPVTRDRSRQIGFAADEAGSTFECSLDNAAYTACVSPISLTGLSEGDHSFKIRAIDKAGNVSGEPAREIWKVDLTPPNTTLIGADPAGEVTESSSIILTFSASETNARFECQRDGSAFAACESPFVINNLADGPHTFAVRAIDAAGNVDPTPATYAWTVDTTPLQISGLKVVDITQTTAVVTWTTNRPATSSVSYTDVVTNVTLSTPATSTLQTSHSVQISGLARFTLYNVVARSTRPSGQSAQTVPLSFRTAR